MIDINNELTKYFEYHIIPYTLAFIIVRLYYKNKIKFNFYTYYKYIIKLYNIKNINYRYIRHITKNILKNKYKLIIISYKPLTFFDLHL